MGNDAEFPSDFPFSTLFRFLCSAKTIFHKLSPTQLLYPLGWSDLVCSDSKRVIVGVKLRIYLVKTCQKFSHSSEKPMFDAHIWLVASGNVTICEFKSWCVSNDEAHRSVLKLRTFSEHWSFQGHLPGAIFSGEKRGGSDTPEAADA